MPLETELDKGLREANIATNPICFDHVVARQSRRLFQRRVIAG